MNKEEALAKFNEEVEWLKQVVPPEDIYMFANQALVSARFFLNRWSDWVDIYKECEEDDTVNGWVMNLCGINHLRSIGSKERLNLKWKEL
jgi:hypothetical protein